MNEILISAISVIITGILTFLGAKLTSFVNEKISDEKTNRMMNQFLDIIFDSVRVTYQKYVEQLKKQEIFSRESHDIAFNMAKEYVYKNLPKSILDFIKNIYPDINKYIDLQIEKAIYELKK